jgi:hypothetical protein
MANIQAIPAVKEAVWSVSPGALVEAAAERNMPAAPADRTQVVEAVMEPTASWASEAQVVPEVLRRRRSMEKPAVAAGVVAAVITEAVAVAPVQRKGAATG